MIENLVPHCLSSLRNLKHLTKSKKFWLENVIDSYAEIWKNEVENRESSGILGDVIWGIRGSEFLLLSNSFEFKAKGKMQLLLDVVEIWKKLKCNFMPLVQ